jgi:hypothetical protein
MDAAATARSFMSQFERMEDLDMMAHAKAGDSRRAHDFVRVDLPLMIDVFEGRDPAMREDITPRQSALLELGPADMAERINSDMRGARRVIGWSAPHAKGEMKDFVLDRETFSHELRNDFIAKREMQQAPDLSAGYTNSAEAPLDPEQFLRVRSQESHMGYFRPGDSAIISPKDHDPHVDPYSAESKRIEEVQLSSPGEDSPYYLAKFRLEGDEHFHDRGELLDPRGTQYTYGVIAESAGRLYFVEIDTPHGPNEPENMVAREVVGIEKSMIDRIERDIRTAESDRSAYGLVELDMAGNEKSIPPVMPMNMREILGLTQDDKGAVSGEYTFHPVDGPNDRAGPIVIEANSWASGTDGNERLWAQQAIDRHLERYEHPRRDMVTEAYENSQKRGPTMQTTIGEPRVETSRHVQTAAALSAMNQSQGM